MWAPPVTVVLYQWEVQCCDVTGGATGGPGGHLVVTSGASHPPSATEDESILPEILFNVPTSIPEAPPGGEQTLLRCSAPGFHLLACLLPLVPPPPANQITS